MIATETISYDYPELIRYEYGLSVRDEHLKSSELLAVTNILVALRILAKGHLDVGTFTARYPRALRFWVVGIEEGGQIIGVDNNRTCVNFAKKRVRETVGDDPRIHILERDFLKFRSRDFGKFDLITVMLSTLSHFGYDRNDRYEDTLQQALANMADLLSEHGILILSNWSEEACARLDMLEIYDDSEKERLASWTPSSAELKERLHKVRLRIVGDVFIEDRLQVIVCGAHH